MADGKGGPDIGNGLNEARWPAWARRIWAGPAAAAAAARWRVPANLRADC
jgi:hypothetical protein